MASVIHGFIYNKEALAKVGASEPKTMQEFHALLDTLKKDGTYVPLVMGAADQSEAATMGFPNIGPDDWKGETGRNDLIKGTEKFTDPQYVAARKELASWGPYMGDGYQAQKYADSQNLFSLGKGAIYPAGSYQILSRGTPNLENELWNVSAQVIDGGLTPDAATKQLQAGLDKWYKPAK